MGNNVRKDALNIAVVGVGSILPGALDSLAFWRNILDGKDAISDIPSDYWLIEDYYDKEPGKSDKVNCKKGAFIPETDFDPMEFGLPPKLLKSTDIIQLLALLAAKQVVGDTASLLQNKINRDRISVILGVSGFTQLAGQMVSKVQKPLWLKAMREHGIEEGKAQAVCEEIFNSFQDWDENSFPGYLNNIIAGRIANRFNFRGMNCTVDSACGSSLGALNLAVDELLLGKSDMVIAGGGDATNDIFTFFSFERTHAISPTGDCRPFSEDADGTILGEGVVMFALRRREDAERDGDKIYALLQGIGTSSDGKSKSIYAPSSDGQALAINKAYENSGYKIDEVELIEAHGTGTLAGDRVEFTGLMKAFNESLEKGVRQCALGSVKSQIGHSKGSAGSAGLLKTILALHHKVLPGTIKVSKPNSRLKLEQSPFYLNTMTRPWIHDKRSTRKAGVSAFGFGGSNYHVTLEEYTGSAEKPLKIRISPVELFLFSGTSVVDLKSEIDRLSTMFMEKSFSSAARLTQENFKTSDYRRLAILAHDAVEFESLSKQALEKIIAKEEVELSIPDKIYYYIGSKEGKVAYIFPGQGSQYVNMGSDMAIAFDEVRSIWDTVAACDFRDNKNLAQVVFPVPVFEEAQRKEQQELLTKTQWAQPAIGAMSISLLALLKKLELKPDFAAGHSFGEITSLFAAGIINNPEDFIRISRRRGELMAEAAANSAGTMTAVFTSGEVIDKILKQSNTEVCIANYNSPMQVVISGATAQIEEIERILDSQTIKFQRLSVSAAFHSKHVKSSQTPFYEYISNKEFNSPVFGVYSNLSAEIYPEEPERIKDILSEQLSSPVRFNSIINNLYQQDTRIFVEVGPGSVMSKLISDCLINKEHYTIPLDRKGKNGVASFWNALAQLSAIGVKLSYNELWKGFSSDDTHHRELSPVSMKISGALHSKSYPPKVGLASMYKQYPEVKVAESEKSFNKKIEVIGPELENSTNREKYSDQEGNFNMNMNSQEDSVLITTLIQIQKSASAAEETFQKTITESHTAYLKAVEETMRQINVMNGKISSEVIHEIGSQSARISSIFSPQAINSYDIYNEINTPSASSIAAHMQKSSGYPANEDYSENGDEKAATLTEAKAEDIDTGLAAADIKEILLEIVAEKTGYPIDMLQLDMDLEADLGIDSIKKVEILAGLSERIPQLSAVDSTSLISLKTLGEIIEQAKGINFVTNKETASAERTAASENKKTSVAIDVENILLQVVSDKTGYPADMLDLDMDLEADLGIDSIKRIEIFAALKEQLPELAESDISQIAALKTLREIIYYSNHPATDLLPPLSKTEKQDFQVKSTEQIKSFTLVSRECSLDNQSEPGITNSYTLFITRDQRGIAEELVKLFMKADIVVEITDSIPENTRALIYLKGLDIKPSNNFSECCAMLQDAFEAARTCGRNIYDHNGVFITVQDTGGDFGVSNRVDNTSWAGGLSGLAKTCSKEWSGSLVKAIDIDSSEMTVQEIAEELYKEIMYGRTEIEVGITALRKRLTLELAGIEKPYEKFAPEEDSLFIVSGGARGITAQCIIELAKNHKLRFALLGRTELISEPIELKGYLTEAELKKAIFEMEGRGGSKSPLEITQKTEAILSAREIRKNIKELETNGAMAEYYCVDIRSFEKVNQLVEQIRIKHGEIKGIIHGAGVLADKLIHEKTDKQFINVFETKVNGFYNLLNATKMDKLSHICCFTSVAARFGNPGQADYSMANEVLNKVCRHEFIKREGKCLVKAINWGPWDGGMVTPFLKLQFEKAGITLINPALGAEKFVEELMKLDENAIEVVIGGMQ